MQFSAPQGACVDSLPPETLVMVFREVTDQPIALMQLASVCHNWRYIVLGASELWHHIKIDFKTRENQLRKQLKLSGDTLLLLDLKWMAPGVLRRLVLQWNSSRPIRERTSSLKVTFRPREDKGKNFTMWWSSLAGNDWPQLTTLVLISQYVMVRIHLRAPKLETIKLHNTCFGDWNHVGFGSALRDAEWSGPGEEAVAFLRTVACSPNLRRLTLFKLDAASLALPRTPAVAPFWPKLTDLTVKWLHADLADVFAILSNAPQLNTLKFKFGILVQSARSILSKSRFSPDLRRLSIKLDAQWEGRSEHIEHMLISALLHGVLELDDAAALKITEIEDGAIALCEVPASCPQLQAVELTKVMLPPDFIHGLRRCPLMHTIFISECRIQGIAPSVAGEDLYPNSLVFGGGTFTGAFTLLRSLTLFDVVVNPEFMAQLAQFLSLEKVFITFLPTRADPGVVEVNWIEVGAIRLPKLRHLYIGIGPMDPGLPYFSLLTPSASHIISAAAQLARGVLSGRVTLQSTPLRAVDFARLLCHPRRVVSNVELYFQVQDTVPEVIYVCFKANVSLADEAEPSIRLEVGIQRTELVDAAEIILSRFPLDGDFKLVYFDEEASNMIRLAIEQSPNAAGLHHLQRLAIIKPRDS